MKILTQVFAAAVFLTAQARAADTHGSAAARAAADFTAAIDADYRPASDTEFSPQLALLEDPDPAVRAQAAKALRPYVLDSRVQRRLSALLEAGSEPDLVKMAALKSLAWGVSGAQTIKAITDCAQNMNNTLSLRDIAYRALYTRTDQKETQSLLLRTMQTDPQPVLRRAAAWAVFLAVREDAVKNALLATAKGPEAPIEVRIEALKTLSELMLDPEALGTVRSLAGDTGQTADLRETAIRCLVLAKKEGETLELLQRLSSTEPDEKLRSAALTASGPMTLDLARYFQWTRWHHQFIDPLAWY